MINFFKHFYNLGTRFNSELPILESRRLECWSQNHNFINSTRLLLMIAGTECNKA